MHVWRRSLVSLIAIVLIVSLLGAGFWAGGSPFDVYIPMVLK